MEFPPEIRRVQPHMCTPLKIGHKLTHTYTQHKLVTKYRTHTYTQHKLTHVHTAPPENWSHQRAFFQSKLTLGHLSTGIVKKIILHTTCIWGLLQTIKVKKIAHYWRYPSILSVGLLAGWMEVGSSALCSDLQLDWDSGLTGGEVEWWP